MKLRSLLLGFLALAAVGRVDAKIDPRAEIAAIPEKSGGVYYAYPYSTDSLAPVPAGYEPVYMSHYGRHGSRWVISEKLYPTTIKRLQQQQSEGNLTAEGERVLRQVEKAAAHAEGHLGELTHLGELQHKGIARRMYDRFPELFQGNQFVRARSSIVPRCIISMAAFSEELMSKNPKLDIRRTATPSDMRIMDGHTDKDALNSKSDAAWRKKWQPIADSLYASPTAAARVFKDPSKVKHLPETMKYIHDIAIDEQDLDNFEIDLMDLFTAEEHYNLWMAYNYLMYVRHANSIEGNSWGPEASVELIQDIVARADSALASEGKHVDLRFGHDTALLRLLAKMGFENVDYSGEGVEEVAPHWQAFTFTPMAANLQLAFFRNGEGDVLVAPRLNERPIKFSKLKEAHPGYYKWSDVRRHLLSAASPVAALLERVSPGSSKNFILEEVKSPEDFFEISAIDGRPAIRANNTVNLAAGLNWYLKYYPHIHLSWNNMEAKIPDVLPLPKKTERHTTDALQRYYLNYCTHSYSMAFWDWARWQKEIDWMALHGINMPLAITGTDLVWRNTMRRLGYSKKEADEFVAGPAFQAWWLMNNLEGWGGPNSDQWYKDREDLQIRILWRMRELGMEPVLPGYAGMVPHDADERMGMEVLGKGIWNGFTRPGFLKTTDPKFNLIADIYYDELTRLCGTSKYYSMDPFHEGGNTKGVNLTEAGKIIAAAMKRANPEAQWVIQGWNENPRKELLDGVNKGDIVVLDLASEIKPNWGDPETPSKTKREDGYAPHDWMFCMLLNFGGNVGLHGRLDNVIGGYYKAKDSKYGKDMTGFGLTPEGIENNPVMYELLPELIWREDRVSRDGWLKEYALARYGANNADVNAAWKSLGATIYNCPWGSLQQGTTESVFCARPSDKVWKVSSWSRMEPYYKPEDVIKAAKRFAKAAPKLKDNENYVYDLVDITRQAVAEKGRLTYEKMQKALAAKDMKAFKTHSDAFLKLIKAQDELLSTRPEFSVETWIADARRLAPSEAEQDNFERNARLLVTTWGPREASEKGKLRDYGHREWAGLLGDLYHTRWTKWIDAQLKGDATPIDWYTVDEAWVNSRDRYPLSSADPVTTALATLAQL